MDDGSTVTDFLPAERARGITIQSAAITFHWPPTDPAEPISTLLPKNFPTHTINLIDTPGHADFTFEVIRSLRILDGAICILDGVAGVEAQTEKVWHQASGYNIPRVIYVNKLDRDGAAFNRTVKEIASRLHTWPLLCQIPWWSPEGTLKGVGDAVNFRGLLWEGGPRDGSQYQSLDPMTLQQTDPKFYDELLAARTALIEGLTEHDEILVEQFLETDEDWEGFPGDKITESLRRVLLSGKQAATPVFAGASFRNIGVQPLLDFVPQLLPSPADSPDPTISFGGEEVEGTLRVLLQNKQDAKFAEKRPAKKGSQSLAIAKNLEACALAFKVVNDPKRGVLVYVRVYSGTLNRAAMLYNTNLKLSERAPRLMRMYANDAVEVQRLETGQIGVIAGLKYARTGDTLLVYTGANAKTGPPVPFDTLQLRPINVPPPLFFTSVEPNSLSEERNMHETLALLLREDPSLSVRTDEESGQTQLAGMGELHLEIARDRLINDLKVKASTGKIEIGYREAITTPSQSHTETFNREIAGSQAEASCTATVSPIEEMNPPTPGVNDAHTQTFALPDNNFMSIHYPYLNAAGTSTNPEKRSLPEDLPLSTVIQSYRTGIQAALARGPTHNLPVHSTHIHLELDVSTHLSSNSTPAALTSSARLAVTSALKASAASSDTVLMEPVMFVTIAVTEAHLGAVVHDISSARGGSVLSLDVESDNADGSADDALDRRLTTAQLARVYAPPDAFAGASATSRDGDASGVNQQRQIQARVPLKEMVGYLKHLRSLTGGRGTFVMSVDRFERMSSVRMKAVFAEMRGDFV